MNDHKNSAPAIENIRIPSNIMLKSAYSNFQKRESNYIIETILELYNYIYVHCKQSDWDNLEIEAKLGKYDFKGDFIYLMQYIREPFKIPVFERNPSIGYNYTYDFVPGLDESHFYSIWYFVDRESERPGSDIIKLEPINIKETNYKSGARLGVYYKNGQPIKEEIIKKENKMHINIRDNGNDFRITSCKETSLSEIFYEDVPTNFREKFRVSYKFRYFRLDLTIVSSHKDLDSSSANEITYEVELEFDEVGKFLRSDNCRNFEEFKMMFLRFFQNVFCLYMATTTEYFDQRFHKPRDKNDSLFGDYIEKNIKL